MTPRTDEHIMDSDLQAQLAPLLAPIPGDDPCGEDASFDLIFDQIREARRADDPHLDQGEWQTELKTADWRLAAGLAERVLRERSKDLQAAVWLAEAWIHRQGLAGAVQAFTLLHDLLETYWDGLHPRLDGDDAEERASKLAWLNANGSAALRQLTLANRPGTSLNDWQTSREVDNLARQNREAYEAAIEEGKPTGEAFDTALAAAGGAHVRAQLESALAARAAFETLQAKTDARFGRDAPNLGLLADALKRLEQVLSRCAQTLGVAPASGAAPAASDASSSSEAAMPADHAPAPSAPPPGAALNLQANNQAAKADALKALADIAAFFKRTEPHNPVSSLLERAIAWADMPLEDWLQEVVRDGSVLAAIRDRIGLPPQD